jgi:hypothetical protein
MISECKKVQVLFSFKSRQRRKLCKKETPLPPHGLARNFATKLPAKNSLISTVFGLVQLKTVKGDLLMELSLVEFFHFPLPGGMTLTH